MAANGLSNGSEPIAPLNRADEVDDVSVPFLYATMRGFLFIKYIFLSMNR